MVPPNLIRKIKKIFDYYTPLDKLEKRDEIRVCALTMNYNDTFHLKNWLRYYGRELSVENLVVIDHSSDHETVDLIRASRCGIINLPKNYFDDTQRADFISGIASSMLKFYDVVIYTDCDEIIIPDPRKYSGLREYFKKNMQDGYTCIGLNVFNEIYEEDPYMFDIPIFKQRKYVRFFSPMCKTLSVRKPVHWSGGFHGSDIGINFGDYSLFMFHMREVDFTQKLRRLTTQRNLKWIDEHAGYRNQRISNRILFEQWGSISLWDKSSNFSEVVEHAKYIEKNVRHSSHFNVVDMNYFPERLYTIPNYFNSPF